MQSTNNGTIYIGIRREDKSVWERRVALTPKSVGIIQDKNPQLQFIVQPSRRRAFQDSEYLQAGAIIQEDLSQCSLIIGVKEVPQNKFIPNTTYMIFSHTIKGQPAQMPLLDEMLQKNVRLIDYERIVDEQERRLIAFGRYAGIAGTLDFFQGLGKYLLHKGWSTPFLKIPQSFTYTSIDQAYSLLENIGNHYTQPGQQLVPDELCPMVFAITGKGRCALGAYEVLEKLPIKEVLPDQLQQLHQDRENPEHKQQIYVTFIEEEHMVQPKNPNVQMTRQHYYKNPDQYQDIFFDRYFPFISCVFQNMYWDYNYPRILSKQQIEYHFKKYPNNHFLGVCDVTCDADGAIEFCSHFTTPDSPFWTYNPLTQQVNDGPMYYPGSILYQSLDFLPCELAEDASNHFSNILQDWIPSIANSDQTQPFENQELLPQIRKAVITSNGQLTPDYQYINNLRQVQPRL